MLGRCLLLLLLLLCCYTNTFYMKPGSGPLDPKHLMKGDSHKFLKLKRRMTTREAGGWIAVTWPGSQWQEVNTAFPVPFFFFFFFGSLGNTALILHFAGTLCCIPAAYCGGLTWALQHSSNKHFALQDALENLKNERGFLPCQGIKWWACPYWVGARFHSLTSASGVILVPWGILPFLQLLIQKERGHEPSLPTLCRCLRYPGGTQRTLDTTLWQLNQTLINHWQQQEHGHLLHLKIFV